MRLEPVTIRLVSVILAVVILILVGTFGYALIESWTLRDGFFMTVITLSTVGYGETHELTMPGRFFTSAFIFLCLFTMTCWSATITSFFVEGDLSGKYRQRKTLKMIRQLQGHTIVCGSGAMAEALIERLMQNRKDVVVVDEDEEKLAQFKSRFRKVHTIKGNPTNELIMAQANVLAAGHVVAAMEDEVDNLLVGITCKDLGGNVTVYARSNNRSIANRMRKAGIDEVVSPCQICGDRVAELIGV